MIALHWKRIHVLSLWLLPVLAAGCASVGPNYRPIQTQVPESWPGISTSINNSLGKTSMPATAPATSGTATVTVSTTAVSSPAASMCTSGMATENLTQWWTVFNDPILNQLITDAIACNLDLKQAQLRVYQARENRGIVQSSLFPQINATGDAQKARAAGAATGKPGFTRGTMNLFQHGLDAAWELDFFGGTRRAVESADASIEASIEDRRNVMVTVIAEVGASYISLRGFQKELVIAHDNVVAQSKSVDLTDKKFKAGISNALDVANARALVATTRAQIPVLETAAQQMTYTIAVLLGREPAALDEMLGKTAPIPAAPPTIPLGIPSELLCRRPDVRRAQAQVHAANAQIGVAKADLFPKFSLTGQFGMSGPKPSSLFNVARRFYNVGPSIDWPIFAGGRIGCNIELQKTLTQEAEIAFKQTVLTALQDVDNAVFAYAKEKEHFEALSDAVKAFQQVVNLSLKLYTDGSTDFLNVITAQRSLYQAQDDLAQSERNLSTDVVAVYKALGGGWDEPEIIECTPRCKDPIGIPVSQH